MAEQTREEREKKWWARWRASRFSWDGLANRIWVGWSVTPDGEVVESARAPEGSKHATLQDYWRDEQAQLIEGDGQRWTRAHCPLTWADGTPTPKARWSEEEHVAFETLLSARLGRARAEESGAPGDEKRGADRRAQFQGCVLRAAPRHPDGPAGPVSVQLDGAYFSGHADFDNVPFSSTAGFNGVHFAANATFRGAHFSAEAWFKHAHFSRSAGFALAKFFRDAVFDNAYFAAFSSFNSAHFSGAATFNTAHFASRALFYSAQFFQDAEFNGAHFTGEGGFTSAQFSGYALFHGAQFQDDAQFDNARFSKVVAFTHAVFNRPAFFSSVSFPTVIEHHSAAFRGARFVDVADFSESGALWIAAFDEAIFEKKLLLDDPDEKSAHREFKDNMLPLAAELHFDPNWALEAEQKRRAAAANLAPLTKWEMRRVRLNAWDRGFKELEGGCRAVKVAMGRERDEHMEQRYYRFQLIARRRQLGTSLAEKLYSWLYDAFSDYGMSLWRPFLSLLVIVIGFGLIYWLWGAVLQGWPPCEGGACSVDPDFWDAMLLSANNVFRPFGIWSSNFAEGHDGDWIPRFLNAFRDPSEGNWQRLLIRLVASVQSLFAVVLFFLFALAVRRRFQIG